MKTTTFWTLTVLGTAVLLLSGCKNRTKGAVTDLDSQYAVDLIRPGAEAPDFKLNTPDGNPLSLSSFRGRTVVLDFWASWCPDCREEAPEVVRMYKAYHSDDVEFIGISMDTDVEAWKQAVAEYGIEYPQVSELKKFHDTDIAEAYGVKWIPSMVVVGPDGRVVLSTVESHKVDSCLRSLLAPVHARKAQQF